MISLLMCGLAPIFGSRARSACSVMNKSSGTVRYSRGMCSAKGKFGSSRIVVSTS